MLAGLIYGFAWGDFWKDGGALMDNPWGVVSLVDVYVGFLLFLGWVWMISWRLNDPQNSYKIVQ